MQLRDFWYIVARSQHLVPGKVLARKVLGEWLAIYRDENSQAVALQDRCMHRNSRLSEGKIKNGCLQCPYHGWVYNSVGQVVEVPSEGENFSALKSRKTISYPTIEVDDYIYVRLNAEPEEDLPVFSMPFYKEPGWDSIRVINRFQNNVTNCVENYIDIPHTAFVHPGVFRNPKNQEFGMTVRRSNGVVTVDYHQETDNLGWWSKFLNPRGEEIVHRDSFFMPNVTSVEYTFAPNRRFFITSQSIPEEDNSTLVYTDVTYNYGMFNWVAKPFMLFTTQFIIAQDIRALKIQNEVIEKYGRKFANTPSDTIHVFVESIRDALEKGKDPRELPEKEIPLSFWV